jgi:two-component system sensor histidine kinase KdpD
MRISELPRPSPERLLKQVQAEDSKRWGARLKIFLGDAPGVGKSYRMLDEARRRRERGEDVVVGAVQRQQSEELQVLLRKLELIEPLKTPGGQAMDLDAILGRAPQVCVVDPLAAENPPGSRNTYRWQDVQELMRNGVSVLTSVNLLHVEEYRGKVQAITGKRTTETIPKSFLLAADDIVIVDVPTDLCLSRRRKTYADGDQQLQGTSALRTSRTGAAADCGSRRCTTRILRSCARYRACLRHSRALPGVHYARVQRESDDRKRQA